jgi:putative nucleotidyltransferase with HDIG domain
MNRHKEYFGDIKKLLAEAYESAGGQGFRFFHSVNVANIAAFIAERTKASSEDKEVAVIAAIFHDVAKYLRIQEGGFLDASHIYEKANTLESHEQQSAQLVRDLLKDSLSEEKIISVQNTIAHHNNPSTLSEKILHDADELSEMGLMNIWKMFTYSAYKKRDIANTIEYWFETDRTRHLEKTSNLFLDESKKEAERRIVMVDSALENLRDQLKIE